MNRAITYISIIFLLSSLNIDAQTTEPGNALQFPSDSIYTVLADDPNHPYVEIPHSTSLNLDTMTVETWFRSDMEGEWFRTLIAKYGATSGQLESWGLGWVLNDSLGVFFRDTGGTMDYIAAPEGLGLDNRWHHIAAAIDADSLWLYIDGYLIGAKERTVAAGGFKNTQPVTLAHHFRAYTRCSLDETRIWNKALTGDEIRANMNIVPTGSEDGLVAYYNYNTGTAGGDNTGLTTLSDVTTNSNDGTLYNFTLNSDTSNWLESYAMVAPTGLKVSATTDNSCTLSWTAPSLGEVENYLLDVSKNSSFSTFVYEAVSVDKTLITYTVEGLDFLETYYFRIRANKTSVQNESQYSNIVSAKTTGIHIRTFPFIEDFESGLGNWTQATDDDFNWTRITGSTSSSFTGPTSAYSENYYMYVESSYPNYPYLTGRLISPIINASSQQFSVLLFSFWYHMYGDTMGYLSVQISTDNGTTWITIYNISGDQGNTWHKKEFDLSAYIETPFQIRINGITGPNYHSDIGLDYITCTGHHNNIGIISVDNPVAPMSSGLHNVDITLENFGTNTNCSYDINWEVNGVAQPTFNYSNTLATGNIDGPFTIGSYDFAPGTSDIKIWASDVNNYPDLDYSNDTIEVSFCTALDTGTYTIGSIGDYLTFNDVADALNNCGVSGPVEFIVEPGVYDECFRLYEIPGASAVNTVTFNGVNAELVKITADASIQPAVIELQGTDYLTIKNLSIENTGIAKAWGIHMQQGADYNRIDSNRIIVPNYNWIDNVCPIVASNSKYDDYSEGNNANYCVISNNTIIGGEMGLHLEGNDTVSLMKGIEILNNDISEAKNYGIFIDNPDFITISGNNIYNMVNTNAVGMYLLDPVNFYIDGNNIISNDYGLYILNGDSTYTPSGKSNITNNMIYGKNNYAIYLENIKETNVFHNTCAGFGGFYISGLVNDDIRNNIFTAEEGYAFYSADTVTSNMDYNLYHTLETNIHFIYEAGDQSDLASWQSANTSINVNSTEIDPVFVAADDLHVLSPFADNLGDNSVGLTLDIDGDSRPMSPSVTVDIGADEFSPDSVNVETVDLFTDPAICGDSLTGVYIIIRNLGVDTLVTVPLTVNVTNAITQTLNVSFNDTLTFNESDTIPLGTINTYGGGTFVFQAYTGLANDMDMTNDTLLTSMWLNPLLLPEVTYAPFCSGEQACLVASSNSGVIWYDSLNGGNIIGTGDIFCTSILNSETAFYAGLAPITDSLETAYAPSSECSNGNMFDITAVNNIKIDSLALNFAYPGAQTAELYYIANGTYLGNETDSAAWTSWATINVNSEGGYTVIDPGIPLNINTGETYAVYINYNAVYSDGNNVFSDENMGISAGAGLDVRFDSVNNSSTFNGTIFYSMDACNLSRRIVNTIPKPLTKAGFTYIADELEVSFISTAENAESVDYDFGNGYNSYLSNPVITYTMDDSYKVYQVAYNSCGTDTSNVIITVCALPDVGFTYTTDGSEVSFSSIVLDADSVKYDFGDGSETSLNPNPVYTYSESGTYNVCQYTYNNCGTDTICQQIDIVVSSVQEFLNINSIEIYPNPAKEKINIVFDTDNNNPVRISILTLHGVTVTTRNLENVQRKNKYEMDLNNVSPGIYMIEFRARDAVITRKLVVE